MRRRDVAGIVGDAFEQFLRLEFGDESLVDGDQGLQLAFLAMQVFQLPVAFHDAGGCGGEGELEFQIGIVEGVNVIPVDVDDAHDMAIGADHGRDHFGAHMVANPHVTRVFAYIGHQLRATVEGDPAGNSLAKTEGQILVRGAVALVGDFDLQFAGLGVEQGDIAGGGVEGLDDDFEDGLEHDARFVASSREGADAVKGGKSARVVRKLDRREFDEAEARGARLS